MPIKRKYNDLVIRPLPSSKDHIKQPYLSEKNIIPRINSSSLFIGASGSGKSNLVANLLTRKDMLGKAFDRIFLISPTAKTDDIQGHLNIDPDDIIDNLNEAPSILREIQDEQREIIESEGPLKAPKILVIFDDCISDADLMKSKEFIDSFILCRHFNMTTMICSQSYKSVPKKCRLQAKNIFFFKSSQTETECICEDRAPPNFTKKESIQLVEFATCDPYSFLHISMLEPYETRYRKNLDEIIDITLKKELSNNGHSKSKVGSLEEGSSVSLTTTSTECKE